LLTTLKNRLEKLGNVIVVAPKDERSGIGKALTTDHIKIMDRVGGCLRISLLNINVL
jgi:Predicted acid phosphatase